MEYTSWEECENPTNKDILKTYKLPDGFRFPRGYFIKGKIMSLILRLKNKLRRRDG